MPKFKAEYLFNKIYDFEGVKEIEAKDIKEAIEKLKRVGKNGHLLDEIIEIVDKPVYQPVHMHVYNSEKFNDFIEAQESDDAFEKESPDIASHLDFNFDN
jgi:hypothetical protein